MEQGVRVLDTYQANQQTNRGVFDDPRRVDVLGCPIDPLTTSQTVQQCIELIDRGESPGYHVSVNAAKAVQCSRDEGLARCVRDAQIVTADGQGIVWAAKLLGQALPERVAGIDLMRHLMIAAEQRGLSIYILGATDEALDRALTHLRERHPRLAIAGARNGYFDVAEEPRVARQVRAAGADILFVAMSSPRKELWLDRYTERTGVRFAMGVGGAVDVLAGKRARAPRWVQRSGCEWLFRMLQEPRRMWRRYLIGNLRFGWLLCSELIALQRAGRTPPEMR